MNTYKYVSKSVKKRDVAIDFVKVIATILVLNSHMGICYGKYSMLATGGGIGDALFFFVSGFTLFLGNKMNFVDWYKRRLGRIYPTVLAVGLVSCIFFGAQFSFMEVMVAEQYWFLQCILVLYVILYPIIRYSWKMTICIPIVITVMLIVYFTCYDFTDSGLFYGINNYFRWIFYSVIMLIGGGICLIRNMIRYKTLALPIFLICLCLWYVSLKIWGNSNLQIISGIALVGVCVFAYIIGKSPRVEMLFESKILGNILYIVGNLCLECYMIQYLFFTNHFNYLFPFNIPIIMIVVLIASYFVHLLSEIIKQIFDSKSFDWKILLLCKK